MGLLFFFTSSSARWLTPPLHLLLNFCYSVVCWDLGDTHTLKSHSWCCTQNQKEKLRIPGFPHPSRLFHLIQGNTESFPKPAESYNLISESWSVLGPPSGKTCPKHLSQRRPWGILVRRPDHLNCLLSMWRRGGFTQRPFQMTELLTPESPATLWRKLISIILFFWSLHRACDHRWG